MDELDLQCVTLACDTLCDKELRKFFSSFSLPEGKITEEILLSCIRANNDNVGTPRQIDCKCGNKEVYVISVQMRSLDESPDEVARCPVCGRRWVLST